MMFLAWVIIQRDGKEKGIVTFERQPVLCDVSKILIDDAPGGFGFCLRPATVASPQCDRTGNRNKIQKSKLLKNQARFLS
jgi:hypothetical protein